jgi:hypothetical protein
MKYGLKAKLKRDASALREELGLRPTDPLDCFTLCKCLGLEVLSFADLRACMNLPEEMFWPLYENQKGQVVSAVMVRRPVGEVVVYNESHPPVRIQSSIAHEVSHHLCGHQAMTYSNVESEFFRGNSSDEDEEANHLAGYLLMPREGILSLAIEGFKIPQLADNYNVSTQMARWRYNTSGVARQIKARGGRR